MHHFGRLKDDEFNFCKLKYIFYRIKQNIKHYLFYILINSKQNLIFYYRYFQQTSFFIAIQVFNKEVLLSSLMFIHSHAKGKFITILYGK